MDLAAGHYGGPVNDTNVNDIFKERYFLFLVVNKMYGVSTHHLMSVKWWIILAGWHVWIRQC